MTTTPATGHRAAADGLAVAARQRPPVDALHPALDLRGGRRVGAGHRPGRGPYIWDDQGRRYLDALSGLFVVQAGHGRRELAEAAARQAERAGLLPALVLRAPAGDRAGRAPRRAGARLTSTGSSSPPAAARPSRRRGSWPSSTSSCRASRSSTRSSAARSPTTAPRTARCRSPASRRPRRCSSRWCPARFKVPNTNFYRAPEYGDDLEAFGRWAADQIAHRDRDGGPRHGRGGLPRAGAERRRLLPAAARLLPAGPRDLRPLRRPARLRRGHLRLRPARPHVRAPTATATCPT